MRKIMLTLSYTANVTTLIVKEQRTAKAEATMTGKFTWAEQRGFLFQLSHVIT